MRRKILIIEDEEAILDSTAYLLAMQGFKVFEASNGEDGIAIAYSEIPDLILCDVMMPGMGGYEVCRQLAKSPLTATIPLVFVTALASMDNIRKGMTIGADDYVTKPFTIATLIETIEARLTRAGQHQAQAELLVKETKAEVRGRYLREIDDSLGAPLQSLVSSIQFLHEDLRPNQSIDELLRQSEEGKLSERDQYIADALKASSQLYSRIWAMLRSMDRLR